MKKDLSLVQLTKQKLRDAMLRKRMALDEASIRKCSAEIWSRLQHRSEIQASGHLGLYYPFQGEVDLSPHFPELWGAGKKLYFPRLIPSVQKLEFVEVASDGPWSQGPWGLREPSGELPHQEIEALDALIVPGVAFDLKGNRLGFGKGFYDRLLQNYHGRILAVAYDFQVSEEIPTESHDRKIGVLVTERRVLIFDE